MGQQCRRRPRLVYPLPKRLNRVGVGSVSNLCHRRTCQTNLLVDTILVVYMNPSKFGTIV